MAESGFTPFCEFCEELGHSVFDCSERKEWHRETRDPDAALRLDPVIDYDPDADAGEEDDVDDADRPES